MRKFRFNIGTKDMLLLLRNISITLKSGVSLGKALTLFEDDATKKRKGVITHLRTAVEAGHPLSDALEGSPSRFPHIVINLVKTGELGGTLQESLTQVVEHLRKQIALKRKVRSAMMYPTFVFIAIAGLGLSVGIFVLPELIPLFESLDVELPLTTRMLLSTAAFFAVYGMHTAVAVIVFVIALYLVTRLERSKYPMHRLFMYIPYIADVQRKTAIAQMATTMSTLLKSGIPIDEAIPATALSIENRVYRRALMEALPVVQKGRTFAKGLKRNKMFPTMALALIDIGEQTGTLTESLDYLGLYYEDEVDYAVKNLTTALEPILLIFIGLIVGGTVLSIITPIYDVTGSIR